jgi:hypothetical protein
MRLSNGNSSWLVFHRQDLVLKPKGLCRPSSTGLENGEPLHPYCLGTWLLCLKWKIRLEENTSSSSPERIGWGCRTSAIHYIDSITMSAPLDPSRLGRCQTNQGSGEKEPYVAYIQARTNQGDNSRRDCGRGHVLSEILEQARLPLGAGSMQYRLWNNVSVRERSSRTEQGSSSTRPGATLRTEPVPSETIGLANLDDCRPPPPISNSTKTIT